MPLRRSYYFLILTIVPLLFFAQNPQFSRPLNEISVTILKPALLVGNTVVQGVTRSRDAVFNFWKTLRTQGVLESKVLHLESELVRLNELAKENDRLKKLLDFRSLQDFKAIAARIIGSDPLPWKKTLLLDKGERQGIRKDMAVIAPEGLVGRVVETGPSTSRVLLLADPDARVSALTDRSRAQGVVAGDGSHYLRLTYLELESGIAVEETVISSGIGEVFPKGIMIGKVVNLEKDSDGLHLVAQIEPFVHFAKLEEVLCLASSREK